jgi:hypothetical protein
MVRSVLGWCERNGDLAGSIEGFPRNATCPAVASGRDDGVVSDNVVDDSADDRLLSSRAPVVGKGQHPAASPAERWSIHAYPLVCRQGALFKPKTRRAIVEGQMIDV